MDNTILFGRNAVKELLNGSREIDKLLCQSNSGRNNDIVALAKTQGVLIQYCDKKKLDELTDGGNHQGVLAFVAAVHYAAVEDILENARQKGEPPFLVILDGITDPHNLGAIMRTACSAGCHGIILSKRRCCSITGTVAKVAAGAVEHLPVARVSNLASVIDSLKKEGVWIAGADMNGEKDYFNTDLTGSIALVAGSEGEGISRLIREKCDFMVKIPMGGAMESLNVSVAAGIIIYDILRQRLQKGGR